MTLKLTVDLGTVDEYERGAERSAEQDNETEPSSRSRQGYGNDSEIGA